MVCQFKLKFWSGKFLEIEGKGKKNKWQPFSCLFLIWAFPCFSHVDSGDREGTLESCLVSSLRACEPPAGAIILITQGRVPLVRPGSSRGKEPEEECDCSGGNPWLGLFLPFGWLHCNSRNELNWHGSGKRAHPLSMHPLICRPHPKDRGPASIFESDLGRWHDSRVSLALENPWTQIKPEAN